MRSILDKIIALSLTAIFGSAVMPGTLHAAFQHERAPYSGATSSMPHRWFNGGELSSLNISGGTPTPINAAGEHSAIDRANGPSRTIRHPETGVVIYEAWQQDNRLHRLDGPAMVLRDPQNGVVIFEGWFRNGRLHRENGPAYLVRDSAKDIVMLEEWYRDGKLHYRDGAARFVPN